MASLIRALLWCCATLVSVSATFASEIVAGPWMVLRQDGGLIVVVETAEGAKGELRMPAGKPVVGVSRALRRPHQQPSQLIEFTFPSASWRSGPFTVVVGSDNRGGAFPAIPAAEADVRVAIVGGWNYPLRADLDQLAKQLGGPLQLVIALGNHLDLHLGAGGWEAEIPLVILSGNDERSRSIAGDAAADYRQGLQWGSLGFPAGATVEGQIRSIARDLSIWQIFIEPNATWDPSLLAPSELRDARPLLPLVNLCERMRIPLIIGAGRAAGFISEPLSADDKGNIVVSGLIDRPAETERAAQRAPRVVLLPGGEGLSELADTVAEPVEDPAIVGISADNKKLVAVMLPLQSTVAQRLEFTADDDSGTGWGIGAAQELATRWRERADADALEKLSWLDAITLKKANFEPADIAKLLTAAATDDIVKRLLRRYGSFNPEAITLPIEQWPAWLKRDTALRQLARSQYASSSALSDLISNGSDHQILRAVLATIPTRSDGELVTLLFDRLRRQANGELPLETDVIMQHRTLSAVFDGGYLSPTMLRPVAVALKTRITDVAIRGPLDRFLERHGTVRPP
jgi:hypothetical protein